MKPIFFIILVLQCYVGFSQIGPCPGQNLVYNPSFEEITACPNTGGQINLAKRWSSATTIGTPDLLNLCSQTYNIQYENPRTGNGYALAITYNKSFPGTDREFPQGYLVDTLKPNKKYCISYYVSLIDFDTIGCSNMGMYLSRDSIYTNDSLLPLRPQVRNNLNNRLDNKVGWKQVSSIYVARGGEKYIIIGNFDKVEDLDTMFIPGGTTKWAAYFVDDISVIEIANPPCDAVQAAFGYIITNNKVAFKDSSTLSAQDFKWNFGDGDTSIAQKPKHTYPGPGTYIVRLIASNWCSADTIYKTIVIASCPNVQASFTYSISGNVVTFNSSSSLNATAWSWAFGNGQLSNQQNPVLMYAAPGTYTVRLIVSNACSKDTLYKTLTITPVPPPCNNAQASFTYAVSGNTATFTNGSVNATAWSWAFGNGQTSALQNPVQTYSGPGTYNVRLVASNSCSTDTINKAVIIAAPPPPPPPPPCNTVQANYTSVINGNSTNFTDASLNANNWQWNFGDGQTSTLQNPMHIYAAPGTYSVRLIAVNNCSRDTLIKSITIAAPPVAAAFKLYPNPAKGIIKIAYDLRGALQAGLQLFTGNGQLIKEYTINPLLQKTEIDISPLPGGFYLYKLTADGVVNRYGKLVVAPR